MGAVSKRKAFLEAFKRTASISAAAAAVKIERGMHYRWLQDPVYAGQYERAKLEAAEYLEDEAVRRATEGVLEPVFYKGKPVGAIPRYSDGLLQFLLRGVRPEKFRDVQELRGPNGGPVEAKLEVVFVGAAGTEPAPTGQP